MQGTIDDIAYFIKDTASSSIKEKDNKLRNYRYAVNQPEINLLGSYSFEDISSSYFIGKFPVDIHEIFARFRLSLILIFLCKYFRSPFVLPSKRRVQSLTKAYVLKMRFRSNDSITCFCQSCEFLCKILEAFDRKN